MLALGVRRSIQITKANFNFDQVPLSREDFESEIWGSKVYDCGTKQILACILEAYVALAVALTDILQLIYPTTQLEYNRPVEIQVGSQGCQVSLDNWMASFQEALLDMGSVSGRHKLVSLFHGLVKICY